MNDLQRSAMEQALEALEAFMSDELRPYEAAKTAAALRAALAEPQEPVESALQSVAEKIGDQCAVWYGIGARDVEEVLREAARHGLVHGALAEPVQEPVAWAWETSHELAPQDAFSWVQTAIHKMPLYAAPPHRSTAGATYSDVVSDSGMDPR